MRSTVCAGVVAMLLNMSASAAELINVESRIKDKIRYHPLIEDLMGKTDLKNIDIRKIEAKFDSVVFEGTYEEIEKDTRSEFYVTRNCTSTNSTPEFGLSLQVEVGQELQLSSGIEVGFEMKVDVRMPIVEGGGSTTVNLNLSKVEKTSYRQTVITTQKITPSVPPFHALYVQAKRQIRTYRVPFKASILTDAEASLYELALPPIPFFTRTKIFRFSSLYPQESDRMFIAAGELLDSTADELEIYFAEKVLDPNNPEECPPLIPGSNLSAPITVEGAWSPHIPTPEGSQSAAEQAAWRQVSLAGSETLREFDQLASDFEIIDRSRVPDGLEFARVQ